MSSVRVVALEDAGSFEFSEVADETFEGLRINVLDSPPIAGIFPLELDEAFAQHESAVLACRGVLERNQRDNILEAWPAIDFSGDEACLVMEWPARHLH